MSTPGRIAPYLRDDHARLEALLARSVSSDGGLVPEAFDAFRAGLLRHIALEPGGLYATCDDLLAQTADDVIARIVAYPPVKVAAYADGPRVLRTAHDALRVAALQHDRR